MDYLPCEKRVKLVKFEADGSQSHNYQCQEQKAEKANQLVQPKDCEVCKVRTPDPPARPPRKQVIVPLNGVKEVQAPEYPDCKMRLRSELKSCCGRSQTIRLCNEPKAMFYAREVTPVMCKTCPYRSLLR